MRAVPVIALLLALCAGGYAQSDPNGLDLGSPSPSGCAMVYHTGFALCYSEVHEQAAWAAYVLTRGEVEGDKASRKGIPFVEDKAVSTGSATKDDYRNSGFDKGHLVPAADMKWSAKAMRESFLLSNISPQRHDFNAGIWEELESAVRTAARRLGEVTIVTGPVLEAGLPAIGAEGVSVPRRFFKVLLTGTGAQTRAIGFLMPNVTRAETGGQPYTAYAVAVDSVEAVTGLDFFNALDDSIENAAERAADARAWFGADLPSKKAARKRPRP